MPKKSIPPEIEWHIKFDKIVSEREAIYIDALIRMASRHLDTKLNSILDAPCGNGRLHEFLRNYGYGVYGTDINEELIEQARISSSDHADSYFVGDLRNFDLNKKFDAYLSWYNSLGYFDEKGNIAVLNNAAKHLKKNGIIILDIPNKELALEYISNNPKPIFYNDCGKYVAIEHGGIEFVDKICYRIRDEKFYEKIGNDLVFLKAHPVNKIRLYSEEELIKQLSKSGFRHLYSFSGKTFADLNKSAKQMIIVAAKK